MRVLLVGGGGREHALAWSLARSPHCDRLWCAPGNAGIAAIAECVPLGPDDLSGVVYFSRDQQVDLVVVGPEAPLVAGLADRFREAEIPTFGPSAAAAAIEGSKSFAKQLMRERGVPTADFRTFHRIEGARAYLDQCEREGVRSVVVKASGLAGGKGALVCDSIAAARAAAERMLVDHIFGEAGREILIEERLEGEEVSLLAVTDGEACRPCPPAQDYKRIGEGDRGPNTVVMGAHAPAPVATPALLAAAQQEILAPVLRGLAAAGRPFTGCLYAGLMLTRDGPKVIEFNCRFGDPEAQVLLPLLESDLLEHLHAAATGGLASQEFRWTDRRAVCVVLAAGGYPEAYGTGDAIEGLEEAAALPDVLVFHAGTRRADDRVVTAGGRVLSLVGLGDTFQAAAARAYAATDRIQFRGKYLRRDVARRAVERESEGGRGG